MPARHRTMRQTIAWSHDVLADTDRALFAHLSLCSGGCTTETAERVCAPSDLDVLAGGGAGGPEPPAADRQCRRGGTAPQNAGSGGALRSGDAGADARAREVARRHTAWALDAHPTGRGQTVVICVMVSRPLGGANPLLYCDIPGHARCDGRRMWIHVTRDYFHQVLMQALPYPTTPRSLPLPAHCSRSTSAIPTRRICEPSTKCAFPRLGSTEAFSMLSRGSPPWIACRLSKCQFYRLVARRTGSRLPYRRRSASPGSLQMGRASCSSDAATFRFWRTALASSPTSSPG